MWQLPARKLPCTLVSSSTLAGARTNQGNANSEVIGSGGSSMRWGTEQSSLLLGGMASTPRHVIATVVASRQDASCNTEFQKNAL